MSTLFSRVYIRTPGTSVGHTVLSYSVLLTERARGVRARAMVNNPDNEGKSIGPDVNCQLSFSVCHYCHFTCQYSPLGSRHSVVVYYLCHYSLLILKSWLLSPYFLRSHSVTPAAHQPTDLVDSHFPCHYLIVVIHYLGGGDQWSFTFGTY